MAIKIFIDQGHNYTNPNAGAEANGLREQDINYEIGTQLAELLRSNGNFEVRTSRTYPTQNLGTSNATSLEARAAMANEWGADYFISIHSNASVNPDATGSEAYVYRFGSEGAPLASSILTELHNSTGLRTLGVYERPSLYVLRKTNMPATLIELGFLTNEHDAEMLRDDSWLFSEGLYNGILSYFGLL